MPSAPAAKRASRPPHAASCTPAATLDLCGVAPVDLPVYLGFCTVGSTAFSSQLSIQLCIMASAQLDRQHFLFSCLSSCVLWLLHSWIDSIFYLAVYPAVYLGFCTVGSTAFSIQLSIQLCIMASAQVDRQHSLFSCLSGCRSCLLHSWIDSFLCPAVYPAVDLASCTGESTASSIPLRPRINFHEEPSPA